MKTKQFILVVCVALLPVTLGFAAGADEKAVRDADEQWSKVAAAKDLDKTVSFYADDAVVLPPNQAAVTTKDGIRNLWKGFFDSLTEISWKTSRVEMAKSGDMGYLIGTYEMTMKDGSKDKGKYCEVWQKTSRRQMESQHRHVQLGSASAGRVSVSARRLYTKEIERFTLVHEHCDNKGMKIAVRERAFLNRDSFFESQVLRSVISFGPGIPQIVNFWPFKSSVSSRNRLVTSRVLR